MLDWRSIILAMLGILFPILYNLLLDWDPNFPLSELDWGSLLQWGFGWLLHLAGLPAAGVFGYKARILYKLKSEQGYWLTKKTYIGEK